MGQLIGWHKIGRLLSIFWLLGTVIVSTKIVGEDRLRFREKWYEKCFVLKMSHTTLEQKLKNKNEKNEECFIEARLESMRIIPDHILLRKIGYWGILPILLGWLIGIQMAKKSIRKE